LTNNSLYSLPVFQNNNYLFYKYNIFILIYQVILFISKDILKFINYNNKLKIIIYAFIILYYTSFIYFFVCINFVMECSWNIVDAKCVTDSRYKINIEWTLGTSVQLPLQYTYEHNYNIMLNIYFQYSELSTKKHIVNNMF